MVCYDTTLRDGSQQVSQTPPPRRDTSIAARSPENPLHPNELQKAPVRTAPSRLTEPYPFPSQVGISLTCDDKLAVAEHLVSLGVAYIEGGYPGSNPKDVEFFSRWTSSGLADRAAAGGTKLAAFGMTRRRGVTAAEDEGLKALTDCPAPCVCIVAKAWDEQCEKVLGVSPEENIGMIEESVAHLVAAGKEVLVDCEHYFDGRKANPEFAVKCAAAAARSGAKFVVLCDTNGGTLPWDVEEFTREVKEAVDATGMECSVGIHTHNDTSLAVANSIAAVKGGATMVQGCVNGYGERTGNADLLVVAANLELKMGKKALPEGSLPRLTQVSATVAKLCGQHQEPRQPYMGSSAFAHKGGLHVAALQKMPASYNHIVPSLVGNEARSVISELSGRGNILSAAMASGRDVSKETAAQVLAQIKELESRGFVLEDAGASVDILFRRADPNYRAPFNVLEFNVTASNSSFGGFTPNDLPVGGDGRLQEVLPEDELEAPFSHRQQTGYKAGSLSMNQVVVKVEVFDNDTTPASRNTQLCVAEGNGPVNALANALRLALTDRFPQLKQIHLRDYKVDLLSTAGTSAAVTRVTMDFADRDTDTTWRTVGAHASIIEASFRALVDGMEYGIAQCSDDGCMVDAGPGPVASSEREGAPSR